MQVLDPEAGLQPILNWKAQQALGLLADKRELERGGVGLPHNAVGGVDNVTKALLRGIDGILRRFALGNVARNTEHPDDAAVVIAQRPLGDEVNALAIHGRDHFFAAQDLVLGQHTAVVGLDHLGLRRRKKRRVIVFQHLLRGLAQQAPGFTVEQQVAPRKVLGKDRIGRALDDRIEQLLGAQFFRFRFLLTLKSGSHLIDQAPHQAVKQQGGDADK